MTDWSSLKVVDLRAELSNRSLPIKGLKAELVQRLTEDDASTAAPQQEPVVKDETALKAVPPSVDDHVFNDDASDPQTKYSANDANPVDATASVDILSLTEAASVPTAWQEPAPNAIDLAQTVQNDWPASDMTAHSNDVVNDLQKRKRRSSTPQPSMKRARQEGERLAESHESVVSLESEHVNTDRQSTSVSSKNSPNGVEEQAAATEVVNVTGQEPYTTGTSAAVRANWDSMEVSGEDAYAKRVAIAESSKLRSTSVSHSRGQSPARSEEGGHDEPRASAHHPGLLVDESGEDTYAKRVAISESSKLHSPSLPQYADEGRLHSGNTPYSLQPQQSHDYAKHDDQQQSQGARLDGTDESPLPSEHAPTSALYIRELMRPLKPEAMEQHIVDLISTSAKDPDADLIHNFYLDQIRTHAFVHLPSVSSAHLVRAALHNQVWPNERNRKALWVDFIPAENVEDWVKQEESAPRGSRWEVAYEQVGNSIVAVHREVGSGTKSFSRPPPTGPAAAGPVYPGIEAAPRGPRAGGRITFQNSNTRQTEASPQIVYTPKDEDMVRRRIDNMRYFYSRDPPPDLGKDYHRYTFETADAFVDRGREVFIGIRPPHRQREHEERLAAGDGYRPPPRPSVADENRLPRYGDGRRSDRSDWPPRNRGFRNDRGPGRYRGEDPYRYRPGY